MPLKTATRGRVEVRDVLVCGRCPRQHKGNPATPKVPDFPLHARLGVLSAIDRAATCLHYDACLQDPAKLCTSANTEPLEPIPLKCILTEIAALANKRGNTNRNCTRPKRILKKIVRKKKPYRL